MAKITIELDDNLLSDINDWHYEYCIIKRRWRGADMYYVAERSALVCENKKVDP